MFRRVEVLIDVEGVEGGIKGREFGAEAQTALGGGHQRVEIGKVWPVKGLGQFGQDDLPPAGDFGADQARGVAPVVFSDRNSVGG